jgi:hypothetical protein
MCVLCYVDGAKLRRCDEDFSQVGKTLGKIFFGSRVNTGIYFLIVYRHGTEV